MTGNQGDTWKLASVSVPAITQQWQAVFEAIRGNGVLGDIAIDDFSISSSDCGGGGYPGIEWKEKSFTTKEHSYKQRKQHHLSTQFGVQKKICT